MGKYEALPQFLGRLAGSSQRLSFRQLERILGFKLPPSAYEHEAWWSNNATGHSHARAWLEAGWRTEAVDLAARHVTFRRSMPSPHQSPPKRPDPWGCMAGTVTILPGTDLTAPSEERWNAQEGHLVNE